MTANQLRKKVKELQRENNKATLKRVEKIITSGAIDLDSWEDDFRLPKICMSAICKEMSNQWMPFGDSDKKEVENLGHFL